MCGIFGIAKINGDKIREADLAISKHAAKLMEKRGPDDDGFWSNEYVAFSFRRLAIIDLSVTGHQPMISPCGQYTIIFNGELYNYSELKPELLAKGYTFRSTSDTEVVLYALMEWGAGALSRFNGMYAIAFWNNKEQTLLIARDHVGMKPLYYATNNTTFVFGSQLDQILLLIQKRDLHLDKIGLGLFLSVGYYPSPRTVFEEVKQLEPGQWLKLHRDGTQQKGEHFNLHSFYQEHHHYIASTEELRESLKQAVRRHLMSDVPIGTFLSGGLDSGIITGLVQQLMGSSFTAYTLSNKGTVYDEADRATRVANFLKIPHKVVYPEHILQTVKSFHEAYQEPLGDYSGIPSILVTAEAKKEVKVMLSGDGSDEFFFGYNRMCSMLQSAPYYRYPRLIRRFVKKVRPSLPAITYSDFPTMVLKRQSFSNPGMLEDLNVTEEQLTHEFIGPYNRIQDLPADMVIKLNTIYRYFQLQLLKLDRASMFNSIEARVPFADKELMKYTIAYRANDVTSNHYQTRKIPLQNIYQNLYPHIEKQGGLKRGFTIDMQNILTTQLKEFFMDMMNVNSPFFGYFDFKRHREMFLKKNEASPLFNWSLLSLQMWSERHYKP